LRELRTQTTADIIVGTLHWCRGHEKHWPNPDEVNRHLDPGGLRELCERYGVEFVESRREITQYMLDNDLDIPDLLVDTVHQSPYAAHMINANIARHFHRPPAFSYDPRSRERRIDAASDRVTASDDWRDGALHTTGAAAMEIEFTGTRIDLIGRRDPQGGKLKVWIDGIPAGDADVYYATYVQSGPNNYIDLHAREVDYRRIISDRCPHGISLGDNIMPQTWTITMTSDDCDYEIAGSITGPDGQGNAREPFTSDTGQIIIEPDLWRLPNTNRTGDYFTFDVVRSAQGQIDFAGTRGTFRTRVIDGLANGPHTLRIETQGDGPVAIEAFDVFQPPLGAQAPSP
jgi:hypothetical protein